MTPPDDRVLEVLGDLERNEARLLTWGVVDAAMGEDEMLAVIEASAERHGLDLEPDEILEELLEHHLVLEAVDVDPDRYRTRMAEAVRLAAHLRQWLHGRSWMSAANLVADFRFSLRPRSYPARTVTPAAAVDALAGSATGSQLSVIKALLEPDGTHSARSLAEFQVETATRILRGITTGRPGGTIVTAGTGSGKTLAFYLPALAWLADQLDAPAATRIVAIYPRNELLKDQLAQCLAEVDRVGEGGPRPMRVGALFGPTPRNAADVLGKYTPWQHHAAGGRICPYLPCPRCRSDVIWPDFDRESSPPKERLVCTRTGCAWEATGEAFPITRDAIKGEPADILFTTTEMLNRLMSNRQYQPAIGLAGTVHPAVVLLDEVHTYGGTSGAHIAHLLRRWHDAAGGRVQFVGLSATLRDAAGFFAQLAGLREHVVREVTPAPAAMEQRGMEYLLALRGNPMAQTALLSTTIQALMLGARIIDPPGRHGVAGSRIFAFTDKLDLANRLFHFYSDAEGWGPFGKPSPQGPLAALRAPARADGDRALARAAGQVWDGPTEIGHDLTAGRVRVGITTSQQGGVEEREVIVATAALEVGYNDDRVGLVLQHKAPRDPAAFLQRRGRAGRRREQRPWTVAVLSDYGRDRLAYQAYEQLFEPELPARSLPIANQAVRRMQAAYSTLDWLAAQRRRGTSVWDDLTKPRSHDAQTALADEIEQTLTSERQRQRLKQHLTNALQLEAAEVESLLWTPPRAVLTEMLPTALRRLRSGWLHNEKGAGEDLKAPTSPLPDFVPRTLFTDLQLPEVTVTTPTRKDSAEVDEHPLPVQGALTEFAPGNVSFRYALEGAWAASWVPPAEEDPDNGGDTLRAEAFCVTYEDLGQIDTTSGPRRLIRPWRIRTERRPPTVLDSSRGHLQWDGGPLVTGPGAHLDLPSGTAWEPIVRRAESHIHASQAAIKVRRYAASFAADVAYQGGERESCRADFTLEGQPAAVGFEYDADGLAFHVEIPHHSLLPDSSDPERLRGFRAAWFAERLHRDSALMATSSVFQREQLERAYLATLADEALSADADLEEARARIEPDVGARLAGAIDIIFGSQEDLTAPAGGLDDLKALCDGRDVVDALDRAAEAWSLPLTQAAETWARDRFRSSVAAALADAAQGLCRDFDLEEEVVVDIAHDDDDDRAIVWFVERSPGGGGLIETLIRRIAERPRHFFALLDRAARPSDFEVVDRSLRAVLDDLTDAGSHLAGPFSTYRAAASNDDRLAALQAIRADLPHVGAPAIHPVVAAIATRLIKQGSSPLTDAAITRLARRWMDAERTLGVELEPTVFAYTQRRDTELDALIPTDGRVSETRRVGAAAATLWMRGWRARAEGLNTYSPYRRFPPTDRLALERTRGALAAAIDPTSSDWRAAVDRELRDRGVCVLEHESRARIAAALRDVTVVPTDTGTLLLHPRVVSLEADEHRCRATIVLDDGTTG